MASVGVLSLPVLSATQSTAPLSLTHSLALSARNAGKLPKSCASAVNGDGGRVKYTNRALYDSPSYADSMDLTTSSMLRSSSLVMASRFRERFEHRPCTLTRTTSETIVDTSAEQLGFPKRQRTDATVSYGKLLPSARATKGYVANAVPKPPKILSFWGKWFEQATRPHKVFIEYHCSSQTFRVTSQSLFLHAPVLMRCYRVENGHRTMIVTADDLHVGATLELLGKKVVLKQCGSLETLNWIDFKAKTLLHVKKRLEKELGKFCVVSHTSTFMTGKSVSVQNSHYFAGYSLHDSHVPMGGRAHISGLRFDVGRLSDALRRFRWDEASIRRVQKPLFEVMWPHEKRAKTS